MICVYMKYFQLMKGKIHTYEIIVCRINFPVIDYFIYSVFVINYNIIVLKPAIILSKMFTVLYSLPSFKYLSFALISRLENNLNII